MNENKNLIIGALIAVVVIGGGYLLWSNTPSGVPPLATSTPPGTGTPPPPAQAADAPIVKTDSAVTTSVSTASVTGHVTPNGAPTTYWYEYGETTAFGSRTQAQTLGSGFTAIVSPGYITGLRANTVYYFRLSAQNKFSTVHGSNYNFETNNNPPPRAQAPTVSTNASTDIARSTATLNGHVNPNGFSTTYWFEYGRDATLGSVTTFQQIGGDTALHATAVGLSGLSPVTKYYFRVNAQNQYGTVNGALQNFTTLGPPAAGQPAVDTTAASNGTPTTVTFNGRINPNGAATTYWFEYSKDPTLKTLIGSGTSPKVVAAGSAIVNVSAGATGLSKNTKYYYRLVGVNQYGTVRGDIVSVVTKP